ncbi:hypothetical protein GYMLUDRAFT_864947 [Collybiopsis luxurians FD-317 M1]|nr:hypothetical protein GYMLUDRAFT_864947 [Collybiopsis luxurians FD-317 M1]
MRCSRTDARVCLSCLVMRCITSILCSILQQILSVPRGPAATDLLFHDKICHLLARDQTFSGYHCAFILFHLLLVVMIRNRCAFPQVLAPISHQENPSNVVQLIFPNYSRL